MRKSFGERGGGPAGIFAVISIMSMALAGLLMMALPFLGGISAWILAAYVVYENLSPTKLPKNKIIAGLALVAAAGMAVTQKSLGPSEPLGRFIIRFLTLGAL